MLQLMQKKLYYQAGYGLPVEIPMEQPVILHIVMLVIYKDEVLSKHM